MQYFNDAARLWRECVSKSGQADIIEGELLRAVEKLRDEAIILLDYESGYKGRGDLEITFDDDALKNPSNAPAEGQTTLEDSVSAGEGVRGDVVRGEGAGPRMRDRRCPLPHRHGLRRGLALRHTVVPGQACPQA
jgi:hypothetical protein